MEDYNFDNLSNFQNDIPNRDEFKRKPQFLKAFGVGLGTSVIVGAALALLGMLLETELMIALLIGGAIVGAVITKYVPHRSFGGALIGAILCPATYFIYQVIMTVNGYEYEKDGDITFFLLLVGSAIYGAIMGYNKKEN